MATFIHGGILVAAGAADGRDRQQPFSVRLPASQPGHASVAVTLSIYA
jgi:hypothetical protein